MASGSIKCMACPDYESPDREAYREHCATKWHQYNTNERMMGRRTLSEEEYLAKIAPPPPVAPETKVEEIKESEAQGEHVSVCVVFRHKEEKWSHIFKIPKGTTVMDLKKSMVKPSSPSDDAWPQLMQQLKHTQRLEFRLAIEPQGSPLQLEKRHDTPIPLRNY
ncbi:unnamed protein product [Durusdinium trenchii]|uniref:Ubiquitin-like domain-containing protein n=1 Tax=Durusdinium trenchii TaxID=1381693 RepID=A0ABP0H4M0_9DINO